MNIIMDEYTAMEVTEDILFKRWLRSKFNSSLDYSEFLDEDSTKAFRLIFRRNVLNFTDLYDDVAKDRYLRNGLIIVFYSLIILTSMFGNCLVVKVILGHRRLRIKTTNFLILNLSLSDILMTFSIPVTVARLILNDWPLGSFLCILAPFIQVTSVMVSAISMAIIAMDRYQVIINPLKTRFCNKVPKWLLMLVVWTTAAILAIPHSIFNRSTETFGARPMFRCRSIWPEPRDFYKKLSTITTVLTQYLVPLSVTFFIYGLIAVKICRRGMIGEMTAQQMSQRASSKRKTVRMLMLVVVVFAVCWLPLNLFLVFDDLFELLDLPIRFNLYLVCHWLAFSSVCWNPFIYFGLNRYYRQGLRRMCLFRNLLHNNSESNTSHRSTTFVTHTSVGNTRGSERRKSNISLISGKTNTKTNRVSDNSVKNSLLDKTCDDRCSHDRCQCPASNSRNLFNNNHIGNTSF